MVVVRVPVEPLEGPAFDEHCKQLFDYFARGRSFGWVIDVRHATPLTAEQRRTIAEKSDEYAAKYPEVKCFVAVVLSSAIMRGITRTITWLTRQPMPTLVCATVEEGVAWVSKSLAAGADGERRAAP